MKALNFVFIKFVLTTFIFVIVIVIYSFEIGFVCSCFVFTNSCASSDQLKDLHQRCTKEMDAYAGCMYYNTNEFELCRNEQKEFEKACPLE